MLRVRHEHPIIRPVADYGQWLERSAITTRHYPHRRVCHEIVHCRSHLKTAAALGPGPEPGRAADRSRGQSPGSCRVPGTDPARTSWRCEAAGRSSGACVPPCSARSRTSTSSTSPSTRRSSGSRSSDLATCRFVREKAGRAVAGPAGRGQELPGPGHRASGDQVRHAGAVPLDLRPGPRLPDEEATRRRSRTRCWPAISSRTC